MALVYASPVTMTVTNLQSLASSPTAGWQGAQVDNTSTVYIDFLIQFVLTHANTAPANSKGEYLYVGAGDETGKLTNPLTGTEGTLTLLDVTTQPQALARLGFNPYTTQNETVESRVYSLCAALMLPVAPPFWAPALINHSGAALGTSCTVKYVGVSFS